MIRTGIFLLFSLFFNFYAIAQGNRDSPTCQDDKEMIGCQVIFGAATIILGDLQNKIFTGVSDKGSQYSGEVKNGKPHGNGKLKTISGLRYEGEFKEGFFHGLGLFYNQDGSYYQGYYKNGKRDGRGTYYSKDQIPLKDGLWSDHYLIEGTIIRNGDTLIGSFFKDNPHGMLKRINSKGIVDAEGTWENGHLKNGWYLTGSGRKYEGEMKEGRLHGKGILYDKNGRIIYEGEWVEGKLVEGTQYYDGGGKYVGSFKNGKKHGNGVEYNKFDMPSARGNWENDVSPVDQIINRIESAAASRRNLYKQKFDISCNAAIRTRFEKTRTDRYGRSTSVEIQNLEFREILEPKQHEYGNNTALFYVGIFNSVTETRLTDREVVSIYCIINKDEKIIGVEQKLD